MAIGIFIGILPTWGFALILTVGVLALLHLPKAPGALSSFIATPPTIFTIFYPLGYWIGERTFHPQPHLGRGFLAEVQTVTWSNLGDKFHWFLGTAREHFFAFMAGTAIVALGTALLGGIITGFIVRQRRLNYLRQRALRHPQRSNYDPHPSFPSRSPQT